MLNTVYAFRALVLCIFAFSNTLHTITARAQSNSLSADSIEIAECFGVFAVAVNYYMMQSNEPAARLMGSKAAFTLTAFFFAEGNRDGSLEGWKLEQFDDHQAVATPRIESKPGLINSWPVLCAGKMVEFNRSRIDPEALSMGSVQYKTINSLIK